MGCFLKSFIVHLTLVCGGDELSWLEHRTLMPLMQTPFPGVARDFLPRVNFQFRLSFNVCTPVRAITCINICAHNNDPVVHVRVWWFVTTQTYPVCTRSGKSCQLDDCGRSMERKKRRRDCGEKRNKLHIYFSRHQSEIDFEAFAYLSAISNDNMYKFFIYILKVWSRC